MRPQKYLSIMKVVQILVSDDVETARGQACDLIAVVHNIAEAVKRPGRLQGLLSLTNGVDNAEAEAGISIDFNNH